MMRPIAKISPSLKCQNSALIKKTLQILTGNTWKQCHICLWLRLSTLLNTFLNATQKEPYYLRFKKKTRNIYNTSRGHMHIEEIYWQTNLENILQLKHWNVMHCPELVKEHLRRIFFPLESIPGGKNFTARCRNFEFQNAKLRSPINLNILWLP